MSDRCCEHDLYWHHENRGCGYHGYADGRCPCALTFAESLAAHDAAIRVAERERIVRAILADLIEPTPNCPLDEIERARNLGMKDAARIARTDDGGE